MSGQARRWESKRTVPVVYVQDDPLDYELRETSDFEMEDTVVAPQHKKLPAVAAVPVLPRYETQSRHLDGELSLCVCGENSHMPGASCKCVCGKNVNSHVLGASCKQCKQPKLRQGIHDFHIWCHEALDSVVHGFQNLEAWLKYAELTIFFAVFFIAVVWGSGTIAQGCAFDMDTQNDAFYLTYQEANQYLFATSINNYKPDTETNWPLDYPLSLCSSVTDFAGTPVYSTLYGDLEGTAKEPACANGAQYLKYVSGAAMNHTMQYSRDPRFNNKTFPIFTDREDLFYAAFNLKSFPDANLRFVDVDPASTTSDKFSKIIINGIQCRRAFQIADELHFLDCPTGRQQCMDYLEAAELAENDSTDETLLSIAAKYWGRNPSPNGIAPFLNRPYCQCLRFLPPKNMRGEDFYVYDSSASFCGTYCSLYWQVLLALAAGISIFLVMHHVGTEDEKEKEKEKKNDKKPEEDEDEVSLFWWGSLNGICGSKNLGKKPIVLAVLLSTYGCIIFSLTYYSLWVRCKNSQDFESSASITQLMACTIAAPGALFFLGFCILFLRGRFRTIPMGLKSHKQYVADKTKSAL